MCVRNQPFWRTPPGRLVVNRYDTELPAESSVELDSQRRRPSGLDVTFLDPNALVLDVHAPEIGRRLWLCVGEARRSSGR